MRKAAGEQLQPPSASVLGGLSPAALERKITYSPPKRSAPCILRLAKAERDEVEVATAQGVRQRCSR
jgi:hypothetical protein